MHFKLIALFVALASSISFAAEQRQIDKNDYIHCSASKTFGKLVKLGDELLVKSDYSEVVWNNFTTSCIPEKASDEIAQKLKASYVLGCGEGEDRDVFIVSSDKKTITLQDIAQFTCEEETED